MKTKLVTVLLSAILFTALTTRISAQDYTTAVGVNMGAQMGVNFKQFLGPKGAIEATFGYQIPGRGVMVTAAYQHHISLVDNLKLYVGGGMNIGAVGVSSNHKSQFVIGIDPNVGFEYKFDRAPIALAVDYMPQINFFSGCRWSTASFKLRFTL